MNFSVPVRDNARLKALVERVRQDAELWQLWRSANVNAVDRCGISDHGEVHIRIVANAALKILRLLNEGGVETSAVRDHKLAYDDAEVIVVLAACLHDIGISVHRDDHEKYSLWLAYPKARALLAGLYHEPQLTIITQEVLHAVIAHDAEQRCLTVEAGVLKVADATDMTEGRSRIPFESGKINIHSVSALAVKDVKIEKGERRPVRIAVTLSNSAGIFQLDNLLKDKLQNSSIAHWVEVVAQMEEGTTEKRLFEVYTL